MKNILNMSVKLSPKNSKIYEKCLKNNPKHYKIREKYMKSVSKVSHTVFINGGSQHVAQDPARRSQDTKRGRKMIIG